MATKEKVRRAVNTVIIWEEEVSKDIKKGIRYADRLRDAIVKDTELILRKKNIMKKLDAQARRLHGAEMVYKDGKLQGELLDETLMGKLRRAIEHNSKIRLLELELDKEEIKEIRNAIKELSIAMKGENMIDRSGLLSDKLRNKIGTLSKLDMTEMYYELNILKFLEGVREDIKYLVSLIKEQKGYVEERPGSWSTKLATSLVVEIRHHRDLVERLSKMKLLTFKEGKLRKIKESELRKIKESLEKLVD